MVALRQTALGEALLQQRAQRVEVSHVVTRPVLKPCLHYLKLERQQLRKHVRARLGGFNGVQCIEEIGRLGRRLVEQAQTGKAR